MHITLFIKQTCMFMESLQCWTIPVSAGFDNRETIYCIYRQNKMFIYWRLNINCWFIIQWKGVVDISDIINMTYGNCGQTISLLNQINIVTGEKPGLDSTIWIETFNWSATAWVVQSLMGLDHTPSMFILMRVKAFVSNILKGFKARARRPKGCKIYCFNQ